MSDVVAVVLAVAVVVGFFAFAYWAASRSR